MNPKLRDTLIVLVALGGVVREAIIGGVERPYLYALYGAMLGLPFFLAKDRKPPEQPPRPMAGAQRAGEGGET